MSVHLRWQTWWQAVLKGHWGAAAGHCQCEEWGLHHALLTDLPFSEVLQTISTLRQLPQGPDAVQSAAQLTSAHATHLILQPPLAVLATGVMEPYPAMLLRADAALLAAVLVVAALTAVTD